MLLLVMVSRIWYVSEKREEILNSIADSILVRAGLKNKARYTEKRKDVKQKLSSILNIKTKTNYQFLEMLKNNESYLKGEITAQFFADNSYFVDKLLQ